MKTRHLPFDPRQQGSVLIVALMLLVILTLLGVTSLGNMTMEERMAASYQRMEEAYNYAQDETNDEMARWNKAALGGAYVEAEDYIRVAHAKANEEGNEENRCTTDYPEVRELTPNEHNSGTSVSATMTTTYLGGKSAALLMPDYDASEFVVEQFNITADATVSTATTVAGRSVQTQTVTWVKQGSPTPCPES